VVNFVRKWGGEGAFEALVDRRGVQSVVCRIREVLVTERGEAEETREEREGSERGEAGARRTGICVLRVVGEVVVSFTFLCCCCFDFCFPVSLFSGTWRSAETSFADYVRLTSSACSAWHFRSIRILGSGFLCLHSMS